MIVMIRELKVDTHIHTIYSGDCKSPVEDVVKKAAAEGLDVIGIADHNTTEGALKARDFVEKHRHLLTVLIGQEVMTPDGEVIVFGVEETIERNIPLEELISRAKRLKGFVYIPHPYDRLRHGLGKAMDSILKDIDIIEAFNPHCLVSSFNDKAERYAKLHRKGFAAGSDSHKINEIGKVFTLVESSPDQISILEALKRGKGKMQTQKLTFFEQIANRL